MLRADLEGVPSARMHHQLAACSHHPVQPLPIRRPISGRSSPPRRGEETSQPLQADTACVEKIIDQFMENLAAGSFTCPLPKQMVQGEFTSPESSSRSTRELPSHSPRGRAPSDGRQTPGAPRKQPFPPQGLQLVAQRSARAVTRKTCPATARAARRGSSSRARHF